MDIRSFFKYQVWPVIFVILLFYLTQIFTRPLSLLLVKLFKKEAIHLFPWMFLYVHHFIQMVVALLIILLLGGGIRSYGVTLRSKNLFVVPAVSVGILFGVIMTLVDHLPTILSGSQIAGYDLIPSNIFGELSFSWIFAGISEEIVFRGMMQTYLMKKLSGHVRFLKWHVHVAGVIIAVLFALAHISNFWTRPFIPALGQQIYAFILGLCYAYWYEKSGSLLAPIIGHNFGNGVELSIVFLLKYFGY